MTGNPVGLVGFLQQRMVEIEATGQRLPPSGFAAYLLADIAAKRRIIETAQFYSPELERGDNGEWAFDTVLRLLAAPFSSHPDWQPEWSVE